MKMVPAFPLAPDQGPTNRTEAYSSCFGTLYLRTSAAKCHGHCEIFTNENNEHVRGRLILIADTAICEFLNPTHYSD